MENKRYTLCGGTFLVLLLNAKKQRTNARQNANGITDGLNDSDLFEALIRVAFPEYMSLSGRSIKTFTSAYKSCKKSNNISLPLNDNELINAFENEIKNNYFMPLERMHDFTSKFIDEKTKGKWLLCAIIETIQYDKSISDEQLFYIDNKCSINKQRLLSLSSINLQSFLLGIWHFIITQRKDNTVGNTTFELWHKQPSEPRAKWKFISNIGNNLADDFKINIIPYSVIQESKTNEHLKDRTNTTENNEENLLKNNSNVEYLNNTYNKYHTIKTLLYSVEPKDFYDFYVCNDIAQKMRINTKEYYYNFISDVTAKKLLDLSNFILISGTGGLGKSMMMRHLLLDSVKNYNEIGLLPIFIPLKDYNDSINNLESYIFNIFKNLGGAGNIDSFQTLLKNGKCLLLFDGLDEIKTNHRKKFDTELDNFSDIYSYNLFVLSSRPAVFVSLHRFTELELRPFDKIKALTLIDKLDFRPDEPTIKQHFRDALSTKLFISHRGFAENPLLLTIMLMTYEQFAEIPSKMHVFYHEAYITLSQKHDATKGAYTRTLYTGLTSEKFSDYLAELCARSYSDEKFEFTDIEFDKYFNNLKIKAKDSKNISSVDFRNDLIDNICLMYYENGKYRFTHRSFQEYFCALYFSKQKDKNLKAIGDMFEKCNHSIFTDKTFSMIYDMIPEKVEEYIYQPFLENLFECCDREKGYWTFLLKLYPVIGYELGDTEYFSLNNPKSFIYMSIIMTKNLRKFIKPDILPHYDEFVVDEWIRIPKYNYSNKNSEENDKYDLITITEYNYDSSENYIGYQDIVGRNYEIDINKLLNNEQVYEKVLLLLCNDNFPLKAEYIAVRHYLAELHNMHSINGDDLFDLLD